MERYENGTRVRVRMVPSFRDQDSDAWLYENVEGKVVSSSIISRFQSHMCTVESGPPYLMLVNEYSVMLDTGFEIKKIPEACLEALASV